MITAYAFRCLRLPRQCYLCSPYCVGGEIAAATHDAECANIDDDGACLLR